MKSEMANKIKHAWHQAVTLGHKADLRKAQVGLLILTALGDDRDARHWAHVELKIAKNTASWLIRCGKVLRDEVTDHAVWVAVGWTGVRELLKLDEGERTKVAVKAVKLYQKTERQVGEKRLKSLAGGAPSGKRLPKPDPKAVAHGPTREQLLEDLRKLAAFNPATLDLLSPPVRQAVKDRLSQSA